MTVTARESWTDERLDDFRGHVDQRFDAVDKRFDAVDQRFNRVEGDIRELRADLKKGFGRVEDRFDSLQRTMILGFASMTASVVGALLVTQL